MDNSVLEIFNYFKTILCMCPECNNIMRLSDLHLRTRGKSPKTWLDNYEVNIDKLAEKEGEFAEQERELREQARERGRLQVKSLVKRSMSKEFSRLRYDPYDIKAVLHPIDFVVFNGMNNDSVKNIVMLSKYSENPFLQKLHKGVENAVENKSYDWKVVRVSQDGKVDFE